MYNYVSGHRVSDLSGYLQLCRADVYFGTVFDGGDSVAVHRDVRTGCEGCGRGLRPAHQRSSLQVVCPPRGGTLRTAAGSSPREHAVLQVEGRVHLFPGRAGTGLEEALLEVVAQECVQDWIHG